jgi:hypothetical protein
MIRCILLVLLLFAGAGTSSTDIDPDSHNEPSIDDRPTQGTGGGKFSVADGRIIGPEGKPFIARGLNVLDDNLANVPVSLIQRLFPNLNFIRLAVGGGDCGYPCAQSNAAIEAWVQSVAARHIVVVIESHFTGQPSARTVNLAGEASWYAALAKFFKGNPYVWFGSGNELGNPVSAEHTNVYNAVRGAGNNTIIMMCVTNGGGPRILPDNAAAYTSMTNIVWDQHWYNWMTGGSKVQAKVNANLVNIIDQVQRFTRSADGAIPVIFGETGYNDYVCSGNGHTGGICGATEAVESAMTQGTTSASGFAVWLWTFTPCCAGQTDQVDRHTNTLTKFGQYTAPFITTGRNRLPATPDVPR